MTSASLSLPEMRFYVIRISTGEYLTKVRIISNYFDYEFTTDFSQASRLNDFDSQLVLRRLRTLRETRARREEVTNTDEK
ncbi:MAG TPA: hypothetical protein VGK48_08685 [Terriglobia bacterium]|jgi:hypothetical protein